MRLVDGHLKLVTFCLGIVLFCCHCGIPRSPGKEGLNSDGTPSGSRGREIDMLKTPRPALIKGRPGYQYIVNEYFKTNCSACHSSGSTLGKPFLSADFEEAYVTALTITTAEYVPSITHNKFCGEGCSLTPGGQVYNAVMEWLVNRYD